MAANQPPFSPHGPTSQNNAMPARFSHSMSSVHLFTPVIEFYDYFTSGRSLLSDELHAIYYFLCLAIAG